MEDNGAAGAYPTRVTLDIEGNPLADHRCARERGDAAHLRDGRAGAVAEELRRGRAVDARRTWAARCCGRGTSGGTRSGRRTMRRGGRRTSTCSRARAAEQLVGRTVYGEAHPSAAALNLRGQGVPGLRRRRGGDERGVRFQGESAPRLAAARGGLPCCARLVGLLRRSRMWRRSRRRRRRCSRRRASRRPRRTTRSIGRRA